MPSQLDFRLAAACALTVSLCACSVFMDYEPPKMPESMAVAGVRIGEGRFEKKLYADVRHVRRISEIRMGQFDGAGPEELAVVGNGGAVFLDLQSNVKWSVDFEHGKMFFFAPPASQTDEVNLVDVERDGVTEFLNRGQFHPVILFDSKGRVRWKFDKFHTNDAAAGDMNGDGKPEIVVGFGGSGGVHLLDSSGKRSWQEADGNVWRVAMLDTNGDGRTEIVHSNAGGEIIARDATGKILWTRKHDLYVSHFSVTRWEGDTVPRHLVAADDGAIRIFDRQGTAVATLSAPGAGRLGDAYGTGVIFSKPGPIHVTVITYYVLDRSLLFLHDFKGTLLYHEVLAANCSSVYALPSGKSERLLVGCTGKVHEYVPISGPAKRP